MVRDWVYVVPRLDNDFGKKICEAIYQFTDKHDEQLDSWLTSMWKEAVPYQQEVVGRLAARLEERDLKNDYLVQFYNLNPDLIEKVGLNASIGLVALRYWHLQAWRTLDRLK